MIVWQKSKDIAIKIYSTFRLNKDFGFRDQIQRSAISISNNIAEGFERRSNKEFSRFLYIAKGSSEEMHSMLYIAKELQYISEEDFVNLSSDANEISKIISGLIKKI